jgi:hypothetical protein
MAKPDPKLEIVTVFESDDPIAFELAKAALDDAGVEYTTVGEALPGFGFSPMLNPVRRILIPAERKEWALELISGAEELAEPDRVEGSESGE